MAYVCSAQPRPNGERDCFHAPRWVAAKRLDNPLPRRQRFFQRLHWQADDVARRTFLHRQIGIARQLDRIGPAAAFPLPRLQVVLDLHMGKRFHPHEAAFLPGELPVAGPQPQTDAGPQLVHRAGKRTNDAPRVGLILRLADHFAVQPADGIGGEDQAIADLCRHGLGLQPGEFGDVVPAVAEAASVGSGMLDGRLRTGSRPVRGASGGLANRWRGSGGTGVSGP